MIYKNILTGLTIVFLLFGLIFIFTSSALFFLGNDNVMNEIFAINELKGERMQKRNEKEEIREEDKQNYLLKKSLDEINKELEKGGLETKLTRDDLIEFVIDFIRLCSIIFMVQGIIFVMMSILGIFVLKKRKTRIAMAVGILQEIIFVFGFIVNMMTGNSFVIIFNIVFAVLLVIYIVCVYKIRKGILEEINEQAEAVEII